jgi:hypothetical protein
MQSIASDWPDIKAELNGTAELTEAEGRPRIGDYLQVQSLDDPAERARAFTWLADRVNTFVNVIRPRVRSAVSDYVAKQ